MTVGCRAELGSATARVRRCGAGTADAAGRRTRDLSAAGAEVAYLDLPLADPGAPGVCPHVADDGDVLRVPRSNVPLDTGLLQLESPFAREPVAYAAGERARTGHGR